MALQHPSPPVLHSSAKDILDDAKAAIASVKDTIDTIVKSVTPDTATFANTVLPFLQNENLCLDKKKPLIFYQLVSTDEAIRNASIEAEDLFSKLDVDIGRNKGFADLVTGVKNREESLDTESQRVVDKLLRDFHRNGLYLSKEQQERLAGIKAELNNFESEYEQNRIKSSATGLWLNQDDLDGLLEDFMSGLEKGTDENEGKRFLNFGFAHNRTALRYLKKSEIRKKYYLASANHVTENAELHRKTLMLRIEQAGLLGYKNHAEYELAEKMEKSPEKIDKFLSDLHTGLANWREGLLSKWKAMKAEDEKSTITQDMGFYEWDRFYYTRLTLEKEQEIDKTKLAEYFPLSHVVQSMLSIYEQVFSLKFEKINNFTTWHEDVKLFACYDRAGGKTIFMGWLYLDLHPRAGKFLGFADFPVQPAYLKGDGTRTFPATALVCNLNAPTAEKPSLLNHEQVVILFHELGHGIHDLVAKTKYARFHGAECSGDFNEAPSQMLENWCWQANTLRLIAKHYTALDGPTGQSENTGMLPENLIHKLCNSKQLDNTLQVNALIHLSTFDMAIHQLPANTILKEGDTQKLWNEISHQMLGVDIHPDQINKPFYQYTTYGQFYHNPANMYSYPYSQVISYDMFHSAFKKDPMDADVGLRYRNTVIGKGASEDEKVFLKEFLGRDPEPGAFYRELGLE